MLGDSEAEDLLDDLMAALNALAARGYPVTVKDGHLESRAGAVIPSTRGRWAARVLIPSFASRPPYFAAGTHGLKPGHADALPWPPVPGEFLDEDGF